MATYFCSECSREGEEEVCPLCDALAERIDVDDYQMIEDELKKSHSKDEDFF